MRSSKYIVVLFCFLLMALSAFGQGSDKDTVFVSSWKKGSERVHEQILRAMLNSSIRSYEKDISSESGKIYRLSVKPDLLNSLKGENWVVQLREVITNQDSGKENLGDNLLNFSGPGWRHEFPQEDKAAYFYPNESNHVLVNGYPLIEAKESLYPLRMVRQFEVDGFLVTLSVGEVVFDETNQSKIKCFEIYIKFSNKDE